MTLPHVLIIDDDAGTCAILNRALQSAYTVTSLPSAELAINYLAKDQPPPDVMLVNCQLPVMNGLELLRRLRPRRIRTIMMTSLPDAVDLAVEAMKSGAAHALQKNFDLFQFPALIESVRLGHHPDDEITALREMVRGMTTA